MGCCVSCCYGCCGAKKYKPLPLSDFGKGKFDDRGEVIELPDGRLLCFCDRGVKEGASCTFFFCHGHPGTRLDMVCSTTDKALDKEQCRMITLDRPGQGFSHMQLDRQVKDVAADILFIADHLKIDKFVVSGGSGGGPSVVACAALIPEARILGTVFFGCCGAFDVVKPLPGKKGEIYKDAFEEAEKIPLKIGGLFKQPDKDIAAMYWAGGIAVAQVNPDTFPEKKLKAAFKNCPIDAEALNRNRPFLSSMLDTQQEFLRTGCDALLQEWAFYKKYDSWGVRFEDVPDTTRSLVINGTADVQVPLSHAHWYNTMSANSKMMALEGEGHMSALCDDTAWFCRCMKSVMSDEAFVEPAPFVRTPQTGMAEAVNPMARRSS